MHLVKRTKISDVVKKDLDYLPFSETKKDDEWRLTMMRELPSIHSKELKVDDFDKCEITESLDHICTT